jgi:hypothetical protein
METLAKVYIFTYEHPKSRNFLSHPLVGIRDFKIPRDRDQDVVSRQVYGVKTRVTILILRSGLGSRWALVVRHEYSKYKIVLIPTCDVKYFF